MRSYLLFLFSFCLFTANAHAILPTTGAPTDPTSYIACATPPIHSLSGYRPKLTRGYGFCQITACESGFEIYRNRCAQPPTVKWFSVNRALKRGNYTVQLRAALSRPSNSEVTAQISTASGTQSGYTLSENTITIPAGSSLSNPLILNLTNSTSASNDNILLDIGSVTRGSAQVSIPSPRLTVTLLKNSNNTSSPAPILTVTPLLGSAINLENKNTPITITGTCAPVGSTVSIGGAITNSTTCAAGGVWTTSNSFASASDGALPLSVNLTDSAGHQATPVSLSLTKDTIVPTVTISSTATITFQNQKDYPLSGTCSENGQGVILNIEFSEFGEKTADCTNGSWSKNLDLSGLSNSTVRFSASLSDVAGNKAVMARVGLIKSTPFPYAILTGVPDAGSTSNLSELSSVTVSGNELTSFKYKVVADTNTSCFTDTGYSDYLSSTQSITVDLAAVSDGTVTICAVGKNDYGVAQSSSNTPYTSVTWIKDTTGPTVTNVTSNLEDGIYKYGQVVDIEVSFSEVVKVNESGLRLKLNTNPIRYANYSSGSGTNILTFNYTVLTDDSTPDLDYYNTSSLELNSSSLLDNLGNSARLTLANPGDQGSLSFNKNLVIDATTFSSTIAGVPTGTNNATSLNVTVGGTGVVQYKYKVGLTDSTVCLNMDGYSNDIASTVPITASLLGISDGNLTLCVIGKNALGSYQDINSVTSYTWIKTSSP